MVKRKGRSGCDAGPLKAYPDKQYAPYGAFAFELQPGLAEQARPRRELNREARVQAAIVEWARLVAPDVLIVAVPNGGLRSKAEAARLKWTGVLAGIPDLAIVAPGGRVSFVETKAETGQLSPEQRAIRDALTALGTPPAICRSIEEARSAFAAWGFRTRESAAS
jgi:hypothetical protein